MKEFMIKIETWHKPDFGEQENVSCVAETTSGLVCTLDFDTLKYLTIILHVNTVFSIIVF